MFAGMKPVFYAEGKDLASLFSSVYGEHRRSIDTSDKGKNTKMEKCGNVIRYAAGLVRGKILV